MHPDRMRAIDRRLGRPLCRAMTLALRLGRRLRRPRRAEAQPAVILFIGLAEIGALVLTRPALTRARERFPEARFLFLTFPTGVGMLMLMGFERSQIIVVDPASLATLVRTTLHGLRNVRRNGTCYAVTFEVYSRFATLLAVLSGAVRRAGFHPFREEGGDIGDLFTHKAVYTPHRHIAESYIALIEALGDAGGAEPCAKRCPPDVAGRRLVLPRDEAAVAAVTERAHGMLSGGPPAGGLVLLNCNASDLVPLRRWPDESYVALARRLLDRFPVAIVLTGSASEAATTRAMAARLNDPRVVDFAGRTTLPELIALYHASRLLVTNDSGPAHFASTTDLPAIVLYGPETPRLFGPLGPRQQAMTLALLCSPCVNVYNHKSSACTDNRCLKELTVDVVFDRCAAILAGSESCGR